MVRVVSWELEPVKLVASNEPLESILRRYSRPGKYFKKINGKIECYACAHRCKLKEGQSGICKVRYVENNTLMVPWGYVSGLQIDPIEKKPFYHVFPGSNALSWGMLGCDMKCFYCQNWLTSQALRDPLSGVVPLEATPEKLVDIALKHNVPTLVSTYNEPLITSEWNVEIFKLGKKKNLYSAYVSNGNITPELLEEIRPFLDFYKVDLKTFDDKKYRKLGTKLENVTNGITLLKEKGLWVEVVTLIIPGYNDSEEELRAIANFLVELDPNIPWHVTAFHPDYKAMDYSWTPPSSLIKAATIGKEAGLNFVYAGNIPGRVAELENTYCPHCGELLVERNGYLILKNNIKPPGSCPTCGKKIPGYWFP